MYSIALIGAGRIGKIHAENVQKHPQLRLKYIVDHFAAAAESLAKEHGCQAVSLEEALSDESIEGVIVASSTDTHLDFSLQAARNGKAVFCEKPLDLDTTKASVATQELTEMGAHFFLGFNRRFDPHFMDLRSRIDKGEIGNVETVHITSHDPAPPPISYIEVSGGLFKDMAIHDFDMARFLLDEEPIEVTAFGENLIDPEIGVAGDIDTAKTILRTKSGKLCVISNSRRSGYGYDQRIEVFGSKGRLKVDNIRETAVRTYANDSVQASPLLDFFLERYANAYEREIDHFYNVIAKKEKPSVTAEDGLRALTLADAAFNSLRAKKTVNL